MSQGPSTLSWNTDGTDATGAWTQAGSSLADAYTQKVYVGNFSSYGFSFVWYHAATSTVGDLELQFSWDGTNWADSGATVVAISGASGNTFFNVTAPGGEPYARIFFDRTSDGAAAALSGKFFGRSV